jgi:ribosomal protein S18 acetylase RimI-like enzyme
MKMSQHIFRRAAREDLEVLYAIMLDAARWLASRRIDQWAWVQKPNGVRFLRERLANTEVYLAYVNDEPAATVSLQWQDEIWGERGRDDTAGYMHGLAVKRSASGRGMGNALIDFASGIVLTNGRKMLRLDCMTENPTLRSYYTRAGFIEVGEHRSDKTGFHSALFERPIQG